MKTSKQFEPLGGHLNFEVSCSVLTKKKMKLVFSCFLRVFISEKSCLVARDPSPRVSQRGASQPFQWQLTFYRDVVDKPLRRASFGRFGQISGAIGKSKKIVENWQTSK